MFMLLGAVYLHDLPVLLAEFGIDPVGVIPYKIPHILASIAVLAVPGSLAWGVDATWRALAAVTTTATAPITRLGSYETSVAGNSDTARAIAVLQSAASSYSADQASKGPGAVVAPSKPFIDLAYGYLPLAWAGTLSYYLDNLMSEAGRILPVAAATFGFDQVHLPEFVAHPAVVDSLQATITTGGAALSLGMTRRISRKSWLTVAPQCALIVLFSGALWHTIIH